MVYEETGVNLDFEETGLAELSFLLALIWSSGIDITKQANLKSGSLIRRYIPLICGHEKFSWFFESDEKRVELKQGPKTWDMTRNKTHDKGYLSQFLAFLGTVEPLVALLRQEFGETLAQKLANQSFMHL